MNIGFIAFVVHKERDGKQNDHYCVNGVGHDPILLEQACSHEIGQDKNKK
jgi:hypothetical protein